MSIAALAPPRSLVAELTYRCPLGCLYCSNPIDFARSQDELTTAEWQAAFAQAAQIGVLQLHLTGGEPLLRDDLTELVASAHACDLYINLITSGLGLSDSRLAALRDAGLDHVQLSLQDADEAGADQVAGARAHRRKLEVARTVARLKVPLTLNFVVHRLNLDRLGAMIDLAVGLGARRVELASAQFHGWALLNRRYLMPSRAQNDRAEALARAAAARLRGVIEVAFVRNDYLAGAPKPCMGGWGRGTIVIDPAGRALPCQAAASIPGLEFANVRTHPLGAIWRDSPAFNAWRGVAWMKEPCRSCAMRERDFGGCRCQAFALAGDPAAADPACELSPHHDAIRAALAEPSENVEPVYRAARASRAVSVARTSGKN